MKGSNLVSLTAGLGAALAAGAAHAVAWYFQSPASRWPRPSTGCTR